MALSFTTSTFGPKTDVSYIDIGTDALILEDNLTAFDQRHLEAALEETALADYAMPNGQQTADDYFTPKTRTAAEIAEQYQEDAFRGGVVSALSDHAITLADHEARITDLEPNP